MLNIQKLSYNYNLDKILLEIDHIVDTHGWNNNQISLQSPSGNYHDGVGQVRSLTKKETEYTQQNLPSDWEISKFIKTHDLCRTRILKLLPKTCYSIHWDRSKRVHLAIITDHKCKLLIDDNACHIPDDGHPYMVDTTKYHTALNGTFDVERIHIVGCIK